MREIKAEGRTDMTHYPCMSEADLHKLYTNMYLNTETPSGLFNKVQFDVRYDFCRRGAENMHVMTKSSSHNDDENENDG